MQTTSVSSRHYPAVLAAGFIAGNLASFVKWGTEIPLPPRTPDRGVPPADMLHTFGIDTAGMVYHFSEHTINFAVAGVHHLFSIGFALLYCLVAEIWPRIKRWQGVAFALAVTVAFHGIILPLGGWAPPPWRLPVDELFSETLGHVLWMWTLELVRRDLRNRMTGLPDAEFSNPSRGSVR